MISTIIKKIDLPTLSILIQLFDNKSINILQQEIETKQKAQMVGFEIKGVVLSSFLLNSFSNEFIDENITKVFAKLIRKSANNLTKVASAFTNIEIRELHDDKKEAMGELLSDNLIENINKSDILMKDCFTVINVLLSHNDKLKNLPNIETFLEKLSKKVKTSNIENLHNSFCALVSSLNFDLTENTQIELLDQFYNSRQAIKSQTDRTKYLLHMVQNIKQQNLKALNSLLLTFKLADTEFSYAYALVLATNDKNTLNDLEIKDLIAKSKKSTDVNSNIANFRDFIYPVALEMLKDPQDVDSTRLIKKLLIKDSIFAKKHLYASVTYFDAICLTQIINICSQTAKNQKETNSSNYYTLCIIMCHLADIISNYTLIDLKLDAVTIEMTINGIFALVFEDDKDLSNKNMSFRIIMNAAKQSEFSKIDKNSKAKLCILLAFAKWREGPISDRSITYIFGSNKFIIDENVDISINTNIVNYNKLLKFMYAATNPYIEYFSYVLLVDPSYFKLIAFLHHPNILSRLTRMKNVNALLSHDYKFSPFCLITKDELQSLKHFGYASERDVKYHQSFENIEISTIKDDLRNLALSEEHEDEKFEELTNLNNKTEITDTYYQGLLAISQSLSIFFNRYSDVLTDCHLTALEQFNETLQNSLLKSVYLSDFIKETFKLVFEKLYSRSNSQFKDLGEYYYYVLSDIQTSKIFRKIELFVNKIDIVSCNTINVKLFEILLEILKYTFKHKFEIEYRKKLFLYLANAVFRFETQLIDFYQFICDNLNDLYFNEAFDLIDKFMETLLTIDSTIIDRLLINILDYEDFALKIVLDKLITKTNQNKFNNQAVESYQKIKLLVIAQSDQENIKKMADDLIASSPILKFTPDSFKDLDFKNLLLSFPFDMRDTINQIFSELYLALDKPDQLNFVSNYVKDFLSAIKKEKSNKDFENKEYEDKLKIFITILKRISANIDNSNIVNIFDILFLIEKLEYQDLTKMAIEFGIQVIQERPDLAEQLIKTFQIYFSANVNTLAPLIFIGECAKMNKNLFDKFKDMEQSIIKLLDYQNEAFHQNLAKFLRNLIGFFKNPETDIKKRIQDTMRLKDSLKIRINCYFIAGLIKGASLKFLIKSNVLNDIEKLLSESKKRDLKDIDVGVRYFCVYFINSLWIVFGKAVEPYMKRLIDIVMNFLGDNKDDIRQFAKQIIDSFMQNMSEFGIKQIIPTLLKGCNDKNWKTKLNSILALGAVAYCGSKQLSQSLPVIVPKLTNTINDTNEDVKQAAVKSLSLILSTIKNPEISEMRDVIIKSLSDPFNDNTRSLDVLLSTSFRHYIDGPALSLIMPIIVYGLKNSKTEVGKEKSGKVVANITSLISSDDDIMPHVEVLIDALVSGSRDSHADVRAVSAKAFKNLALRFKFLSNNMMNKLKSVLESEKATSIERVGAAQCFAEILSTMDIKTRDHIIENCLGLTKDNRDYIREGFLSLFVYLPIVMGNQYEGLVYKTIETIVESISHEKEKLRNLAIKSIKILIHNYLKKNIDLLVAPFFEGAVSENKTKRNSSLILLGDVIDILIEEAGNKEDVYTNYPRLFSIFYIMKNDSIGEIRLTANNIYKTFVDNTQKCLKIIYADLIECFINLYSRESEYHNEIAHNGIKEFSYKYGDIFCKKTISNLTLIRNQREDKDKLGACYVFKHFLSNFNNSHLDKERLPYFLNFLLESFALDKESIYSEVSKSLRILSEKTNTVEHVKPLLLSQIAILAKPQVAPEEYEKTINLVCELLKSYSQKLVEFVNSYIFTGELLEWQLDVIIKNSKLYGMLFYSSHGFEQGIGLFFKFLDVS